MRNLLFLRTVWFLEHLFHDVPICHCPCAGRVVLVGQQEAQSRATITTSVWLCLSSDFKTGQEGEKKEGKIILKSFVSAVLLGRFLCLWGTHSEAPSGAWGSL